MKQPTVNLNRILIIQTAFLGDVVLSTGIIQKLKVFYPQAKIDFLLKLQNLSLLQNQPNINHIITFDKKRKWSEMIRIVKYIRNQKYDLVINLHRFASSGIITALSNAKMTVGFSKNPMSMFFTKQVPHIFGTTSHPFHEIDRNNALISAFTDDNAYRPYLQIGDKEIFSIREYTSCDYICIAPSSVWYTKQWSIEKWVGLMRLVPEGIHIYLLGGNSDIALCDTIKNNARRINVKVLAGSLSLLGSATLMKNAIISFVNDSSPTHLASAVDAAVCTVYCSTVPEFGFGPLSTFSRVVQTDEFLKCRPCNLHGYKNCPEKHFKCSTTIDIYKAYRIYEEALGIYLSKNEK